MAPTLGNGFSSRFSVTNVAQKIREKYGRVPNQRNLAKLAKESKLNPNSLSPREVVSLIKKMNLRRLPLSSEKESLARTLLVRNQSLPPNERLSFGEIAKRVGHRDAPVTPSMLKKVNSNVRSEIKSKGGNVTKFTASAKQHDPTLLPKLRTLLAHNWNLSFEDALKQLGVTKMQLQNNLPRYKTNFNSEVTRALKNVIEAFDLRTQRKLSNAELAEKLHITINQVEEYRRRRGRKSGVAVRVANLNDEVLAFLSAFSSPDNGALSKHGMSMLTGASQLTLENSLAQLKKKRLVWEVDYEGSRRYCISHKGISLMNGNNGRAQVSPQRINAFSFEKLNKIRDRLINAKLSAGVDVPANVITILGEMIKKKEREQIKF
jgi:DNA-binding transcriptional regulator YiaG